MFNCLSSEFSILRGIYVASTIKIHLVQGDSGGGLICNGELTGVVSFGMGSFCESNRFPGVFTDVNVYRDFIDFSIGFVGTQDTVPRPSCACTIWHDLNNQLVFIAAVVFSLNN